jgi:hypothetical protein
MNKVFYEVDPFNRLIIGSLAGGKKSRVKKFRQVVNGRFKTDENNELSYEVNKSSGINIPQKIKFSGKYSLDNDHNLVITLNKWNNQCEGNRLTLKTSVMDAKSNEIALLVNSKSGENKSLTYVMKLYGSWQADKQNRLTFGVERDQDSVDGLTLSGAWEINKNNEIVYRRAKSGNDLLFRGHWDIKDKCRLRYVLDKKTGSAFNFQSSLGTLAPKGKDTYAVFDIGISLSKTKRLIRKIIFSGKLKMAKGQELIIGTRDAEEGGVYLKFTKEMFNKNALAYAESIFKGDERYIGGGITFKW